jgi:tripartite-type tricarboxylate transporter receptor subunit TctC
MCDQTTNTTRQINAGTIKAYAVTSKQRVPTLPKLPTLDESGLKGFQVGVWHGVYAPRGTPKAMIEKLVEAVRSGVAEPDFVRRMGELGATVYPNDQISPAALSAQLKSEIDKWGPIIKKAGVYAD